MQPRHEVSAVIEQFGESFARLHQPNTYQLRTLRAIRNCRTVALGGHIDKCTHCGHTHISYNSCRNRHCPKCQGEKREQWIQARSEDLLPVPYYHVVFTLPDVLNQLCLHQPKQMYDLLFKAAWDTLYVFALDKKYLGAFPGMVAILHTWGQTLSLHPHLHCLVPAGGVSLQNNWMPSKYKGRYLFPVKAMSKVFRGKYISSFKRICRQGDIPIDIPLIDELYQKEWVVYSKSSFKNVSSVLEYLGRYTHRIAISNHRIKNISDIDVEFYYKDYRDHDRRKTMSLTGEEFLRRFCMHILPKSYVRIRHYGFLSSTQKHVLKKLQHQLGVKPKQQGEGSSCKPQPKCPLCGNVMIRTEIIMPLRGPPVDYKSWLDVYKQN